LANLAIVSEAIMLKNLQSLEGSSGMAIQFVEMRGHEDFDSAFATVARQAARGGSSLRDSSFVPNARTIVSLEAKHRLPVMFSWNDFPALGGLMAYGVSLADLFRAATYVDKTLKGCQARRFAVEQPTKFELVIN
jgi:putative tryptophan/tyrosine transport system substrate-binding protein